MSKILPEHLTRTAYVYVRQSTSGQLQNNHESRRRQYALADRARNLGWSDVVVIDDDLGQTASGIARSGFERLLAAVCTGEVGAVVSIEASRLARNGRDWHTLLEFCGLVGSIIVDEDGVYDPRFANDRLLLGMKGTFSEMELYTLRQRSQEALKLKASRGELHTSVAVGYVRSSGDRLEKNPDLRVQQAIELVFRKFEQLQSVRQVLLWLRQESITLPYTTYGPDGRSILWKLPVYNSVLKILTNPVFAGAYVFGRTHSQVSLDAGRKRIVRGLKNSPEQWQVLIQDHHEGYISWKTYERYQRLIAENANMKGEMVRGMIRRGEALLAGLLRCGHCGRKLHVAYSGKHGNTSRYACRGAQFNHGLAESCIAFGSMRVDLAVGVEVLRLLNPLGIQAALQAIEQRQTEGDEKQRQVQLALEQARFEASRAQRQYNAVDPDNRLVASELERRWNDRLNMVNRLETELKSLSESAPTEFTLEEHEGLLALGTDLERAWNHPSASPEARKRILRAALKEIVVNLVDNQIRLLLHWQGGDHTELMVHKNRSGQHRWKTDETTEALIQGLARLMPDHSIAALLNRAGKRSAKGHTWTEGRVRSLRGDRHIAVYRDGERAERNEVNLEEAADILKVSKMTTLRLIKSKVLPARQLCPGAPWVIQQEDLDRPAVRQATQVGTRRALSEHSNQQTLKLQ